MVKTKVTAKDAKKVEQIAKTGRAIKLARGEVQRKEKIEDIRNYSKETISFTKERVLKQAKKLGLFKHNKAYKQYEIIVSSAEYKNL